MSSSTEERLWVLTDAANDIWIETLYLDESKLGVPGCKVCKRVLRGGLREGVEVIEVTNGPFSFTIVPSRGMGIWQAHYNGIRLGWDAPAGPGPINPRFVNLESRGKLGWLYGFDEWIVRCGLESNGGPCDDVVPDNMGNPSTVSYTLHGRIANLPAHYVAIKSDPSSKTVSIIGTVREAALFSTCLELHSITSISTNSGNVLSIVDEVSNRKHNTTDRGNRDGVVVSHKLWNTYVGSR
jgi:hypothetical protein